MRKQVFAKVLTDFSIHGKLAPVSITWPDGRVLQVYCNTIKKAGDSYLIPLVINQAARAAADHPSGRFVLATIAHLRHLVN